MVQAIVAARESMDTSGFQKPEGVAEVIGEAVDDETARLRFVSGDGAKELLESRYSSAQDEAFLAGMRARFGLG